MNQKNKLEELPAEIQLLNEKMKQAIESAYRMGIVEGLNRASALIRETKLNP
jgi:ribosomal protein L7Ae-like RNA K-turn-binding protein